MSILGSLLGTNSNRPEPSEKMQNNAGGLMNRFNPLNLASGMFGKRKPGAADNYAGSSAGMKKGLKNKKDPRFVTKSVTSETPVQKGESVTDIAAKLFALFKGSFDEENKEEKIKKNSQKSMEAVRDKRNKELIAALTSEPKDLKKETKDIKKQEDQVKKEIPKQPAAPKPPTVAAPKPGAQPPAAAPKGPAPAQPPTAAAPKGPTPSATPAPKPGPSAAPAPSAVPTIPTGTVAKVVVGGAALAGTTAAMAMPSPAVADVIQKAAKTVGVDIALMYAMAKQESGFNPNAAAKTSSAKGLYQFIKGTWKSMVEKYGSKYPILKQRDAFDPEANALAGALFIKENSEILDQAKIPVNATTVYAAHFLGPGGAKTLLKGDPNKIAASVLPEAAKANKPIFYKTDKTKKPDTNQPRTIQEVINVLFEKVGKYQELYSVALKDSNSGKRLAEASTEGKDLKKQTASAGGTVIVNQNNNIVATADKPRTMTVPRSDASTFVQGATT
jgi:soluble lytic murein transglycosylase-like protein